MNDPSIFGSVLPFEPIALYEQPKTRFIFKMPRVVPDQKGKFESDELFRRLSRESEVGREKKSSLIFVWKAYCWKTFSCLSDCHRLLAVIMS